MKRLQFGGQTPYGLLSRYRSELMGAAMLWIMLFHAYQFRFPYTALDTFKGYGYLGVDVFILLSGMGLGKSLLKNTRGGVYTLCLL